MSQLAGALNMNEELWDKTLLGNHFRGKVQQPVNYFT